MANAGGDRPGAAGGAEQGRKAGDPASAESAAGEPAAGRAPEAAGGGDPVGEIAEAWRRELPEVPVGSIGVITPIWQLAKLFGDDRRRTLARDGVDVATLDLVSVLRRSGPPYTLTTAELGRRSMVTAGAVSQRVARAERAGLVERRPGEGRPRSVLVSLTEEGHRLTEETVGGLLHREDELLGGLTAEERDRLAGLLDRLLRDVQDRLGDDRIGQVGAP
ncbi:MarR family winged helix-turn-helix transcriptional regulator [Nocardiopsis potens]|uniref:MarR family winged helix-turn-helix transcriptional regulator n=1 Tax=Nocardiopsis potens TaxID=1246458 RepID=UPI0003451B7D|nr:MarR family transcriptional regulator [Nocardiopsis potens]